MKPLRFGSYSRRTTSAGMSRFVRLKSTTRKRRLWPPPRQRTVMRPWLLRPPCSRLPSVSAFTGGPFQSSLRSTITSWRWLGVTGLKVLSAIALDSRGHVDLRALGEGDDRFLVVRALAHEAAEALDLALDPQRVDRGHLHIEETLDRRLHLALVRVERHAEGHLVVLGGHGGLLGDHRLAHDLVHALAAELLLLARNDAEPTHLRRASRCSTAARVSTRVSRR